MLVAGCLMLQAENLVPIAPGQADDSFLTVDMADFWSKISKYCVDSDI
jgi:hypothetical protein